jgi:ABC-2 type transport system ATP-binding protein
MYRKMKVAEFLRYYGRLRTGGDLRKQITEWLGRFELADRANQKVETLSKGMSQKVQFIAAALGKPGLMILDEPFTGLDPVNVEALREAMLDMRRRGTTVIFSTHDMAMAEAMCDFIFMIFKGRKVLDGTLAAIQDQFHQDVLRVRLAAGATMPVLDGGVELVRDLGQVREVILKPGTDPQAILARLCSQTRLISFELARPSLHDIFLRIAGPASKEGSHE